MINSIGKRLMPIYLVKFLLSMYDGPEVPNFGARMVSRSFIAYVDSLYKLFGGKAPTDYGRRLVPEYLIKWIEDADYIEFVDDDIAYIKDVPEKALKFAFINKVGFMCYKVEDSQGDFEIEETKVTSVISKDSSNNTIETYSIPDEVQALEGYGWGIDDTCFNYIDFDNKKFIKNVGRVDLGTKTWTYNSGSGFLSAHINDMKSITSGIPNIMISNNYNLVDSNGLSDAPDKSYTSYTNSVFVKDSDYTDATAFKTAMSGVYLYYELATPVETDISEYLGDNIIKVEPEGTLTFVNQYENEVPSEVAYLIPNEE